MAVAHRKQTYEVTNVISARETLRMTLPPFPHVEVRENSKGAWRVFCPDSAFIPCAPVCRLKDVDRNHKHKYEQDFLETHYTPRDYDDAIAWAELLAEGREVKVVPYKTTAERNAEKRQAGKE